MPKHLYQYYLVVIICLEYNRHVSASCDEQRRPSAQYGNSEMPCFFNPTWTGDENSDATVSGLCNTVKRSRVCDPNKVFSKEFNEFLHDNMLKAEKATNGTACNKTSGIQMSIAIVKKIEPKNNIVIRDEVVKSIDEDWVPFLVKEWGVYDCSLLIIIEETHCVLHIHSGSALNMLKEPKIEKILNMTKSALQSTYSNSTVTCSKSLQTVVNDTVHHILDWAQQKQDNGGKDNGGNNNGGSDTSIGIIIGVVIVSFLEQLLRCL